MPILIHFFSNFGRLNTGVVTFAYALQPFLIISHSLYDTHPAFVRLFTILGHVAVKYAVGLLTKQALRQRHRLTALR
jgi:hypothetical protein